MSAMLKKTLTGAAVAALAMGTIAVATSTPAVARGVHGGGFHGGFYGGYHGGWVGRGWGRGWGWGWGWGWPYYYYYPYGYYYPYEYGYPYCYYVRKRVYRHGHFIGYRRIEVCR